MRCPVCSCDRVSSITRQTASKNKRTRLYQCLEKTCKQQFSATSGTIFNDSHLSLVTWFQAIALLVDAKKGMSAKQLQQHMGIGSYKTAWYLCHRIREAMKDLFPTKLTGKVQMDELYIGGKSKRKGPKRPRSRFDTVLGMIEEGGRLRYFHTPDLRAKTLKPIIDRHIRTDVKQIVTDGATVYPWIFDKQFNRVHHTVNHRLMEWVSPKGFTTNHIESAFSLLRRGMIGSFHRVCIKHLHRYLSEFEYRFNARKEPERFTKTVARMVQTNKLPMRQLIDGVLPAAPEAEQPSEPF